MRIKRLLSGGCFGDCNIERLRPRFGARVMQENFYLEAFNNVVSDAYAILRRHQIISVLAMTANVRPASVHRLLHPGPLRLPSLSSPPLHGRMRYDTGFAVRVEASL